MRGGSWRSFNRDVARCAYPPQASARRPLLRHRVSGGVAVCPCFLALISVALSSESSDRSASGGGAGETSPACSNAGFFALSSARRVATSGRAVWKVVRGGSLEQQSRQRALCLSATGINPTTATTTSGFGWCCGLPTFFCPFFWSRRKAGRRAGTTGPVAFRKCAADPRKRVCPPRRRKKNSARQVRSARTPQGRATPGASPAPGAYRSSGTAWSHGPPCPPRSDRARASGESARRWSGSRLPNPAAEQSAYRGDHAARVLVLAAAQPVPLARQPQIQSQLARLLSRRRPVRRPAAARATHRQSHLAVLVERVPQRLRLVRPARVGLRGVLRYNAVNFTRRLARNLDWYRAGQISFAELDASVQGWINHVRYADTWGLREHVFATHPIPARAGSRPPSQPVVLPTPGQEWGLAARILGRLRST